VFPTAVGSGQRFFPEGSSLIKADLVACEAYANGAVYLSYQPRSS
jgi:hypothetical protein